MRGWGPVVTAHPPQIRRDPLGRCYTPDALARVIVDAVDSARPLGPGATVLEPSVGGGAFARAARLRWHDARLIVVDVDPAAPGLAYDADVPAICGDWPTVAREGLPPVDLVIGIPAFGRAVKLATTIRHVLAALEVGRRVVQLVPADYVSASTWHDRVTRSHPPARIWRPIGRPWPLQLREVVVYEWDPEHEGLTTTSPLLWDRSEVLASGRSR